MKDQIYNEMCELLKEKPEVLQGFKVFHYKNEKDSNYFQLFATEYGDLYHSLNGTVNIRSQILETQQGKSSSFNSNVYKAEKTLRIIATIVLVLGTLGTLILLFTTVWVKVGNERIFNSVGLATVITSFLTIVTTWAALNVLSNISINLFKIKEHLESKKN